MLRKLGCETKKYDQTFGAKATNTLCLLEGTCSPEDTMPIGFCGYAWFCNINTVAKISICGLKDALHPKTYIKEASKMHLKSLSYWRVQLLMSFLLPLSLTIHVIKCSTFVISKNTSSTHDGAPYQMITPRIFGFFMSG
jgi:hypothetical protein